MPPLGISNITAGPLSISQAWSRLRGPITGVGTGVCPYADTFGPATPNGVRGYIGPAAGSLQRPHAWYVRTAGSNNNGGDSASVTPDRTGSDGVINSTTTFTSASAAFSPADVGRGICIPGHGPYFRIVSCTNATTVILDRIPTGGGVSSLTWNIGGAWADPRPVWSDAGLGGGIAVSGSGPVQSGDSVYVGAGTYRQVYALNTTIAFAFNGQVNIVGDVTGQYTGDAGMVQLTAYTTNDKTAPSATTLLNLSGKSNLAFSNIMFVGGSAAAVVTATTATSQNITFRDCSFTVGLNVQRVWQLTLPYQTPANWLIDRCFSYNFGGSGGGILLTLTTGVGPNDYDAGVFIQNSVFYNSGSITVFNVVNSGTLTFKGGGLRVRNSLVFHPAGTGYQTVASQNSTVFPCSIYNSVMLGGAQTTVFAGTTGQILEDYNLLYSLSAPANVVSGGHSVSNNSYMPLFHFGQERIWGGLLRPFGEPMAGSPLLGFGNDGGQTPYDLYNRPRPAGGGSGNPLPAVGPLERGNTSAQASSPVPPSGTYTWQGTGPWYQDFLIPVPASAQTFSISVQRDSAYSGPTKPSMLILANPTIGVAAQTLVDGGASGQWNTLTSAAFTPTATGWLTVRIASYDSSGLSVVEFANFTAA